jgi:hypothetical protein
MVVPATLILVVSLAGLASSVQTEGDPLVFVDEKDWLLFDLFLESILDLFPGLLDISFHLVRLAVNFEIVIASGPSNGLFHFAFCNLSGVLGLILF